MKLQHLALALTLLAAGPWTTAQINPGGGDGDHGGGGAGGNDALLFSTTGAGRHATLSGIGVLLSRLDRRDIGVITPAAGASAETFLSDAGYNVVEGDKDGDAILWDPNLGTAIDAITVCGNAAVAKFPRFPDVFISVKANVGVAGMTAVVTPGDIVSPRPGGAFAYLITEAQIRLAFNVVAGQPVDVDAVEMAADGTLYLSLENDTWIQGGALLALDGDMLMIAAADMVYAGCQVMAVTPGAGVIAVYEAQWDNMVAMSGVADTAGAPVAVIGDLDALAFDNAGALTWMSQGSAGPVTLPHFLFSGDTLDGAAVLSTQALGSIAVVNGQPLASAAPMPTTGTQMGLLPGTNPVVLPIGNLCLLDHESVRVVADASPKQPVAGGTMLIEVGGCDALAPLVLMMQLGTATAFGAATGAGITNPGFGLGYAGVPPMMLGGLAADAAGLVTLAAPYGGGILAGLWVAMQPVTAKAGIPAVVVGGPVLLQF